MLNRYRINDEGKAMGRLKDLSAGTIPQHLLEGIERDVLSGIREYAASRARDVACGAEAPELAALRVAD